jgi:type II secretory pathway component HofQ
VTAIDADARSLLIAIARESGLNLVVSTDVRRRVSVSLTNAPADEAIAAIIAQAGLTVSRPVAATPAVVFYQLAVNVNQAPAETIAVRFGTSAELAKWIVDSRAPRTNQP